jgi:hypothetical protein
MLVAFGGGGAIKGKKDYFPVIACLGGIKYFMEPKLHIIYNVRDIPNLNSIFSNTNLG